MRRLRTRDGDLDKGSMRCDANISVRRVGQKEFGTRCEIKNVNSVKFVQQAIEYEAHRQVEVLEAGGVIDQETRLFDPNKGETRTMRSKEDAHDYRYFPDPDLLPLVISQEFVDGIKASLPELPDEKKNRYCETMGLSPYDAMVLSADKASAEYFEAVANDNDPKLAANWIMGELFGRLNKEGKDITESPVSCEQMSGLIALITDDTISGKIAKTVLDKMFETGKDAATIVDEEGLKQVTDTGAIEAVCDEIIAANPDKVEQYQGGKDKLFGFFVGQVMKSTGGKANPAVVNEILKGKLG